MCRSIKRLRIAGQPATPEEIHAAALQFVRKISGYRKPSAANEAGFDRAVDAIATAGSDLLVGLEKRSGIFEKKECRVSTGPIDKS
jgi:hypothetical protein